ncbi:MAG: hypothetical protein HY096_08645 [Nitrospinae bacterium]|nr:hypothetical protein [Nitrospinota bacterium]
MDIKHFHPLYQTIAKIIGAENALKIGKEFGGENIYFPKIDSHMSPLIKHKHQEIFEKFKEKSVKEISKEYGLTRNRIYQIIKEKRAKILNV